MYYFSNVCEFRYGIVFYLRFINTNGNVYCFFFMFKKRVVFLKFLLVFYLELIVVILVVKLDKMFRIELEILIYCFMFWIDSMFVFRYIENEDKRFYTLVFNRFIIIYDGIILG